MPKTRKRVDGVGSPVAFTCPECSGPIRELRNSSILRFRCLVGHSYSAQAMFDSRRERLQAELWHLVSATEESRRLALMMAAQSRREGLIGAARDFERAARGCAAQSELLRRLLRTMPSAHSDERVVRRRA